LAAQDTHKFLPTRKHYIEVQQSRRDERAEGELQLCISSQLLWYVLNEGKASGAQNSQKWSSSRSISCGNSWRPSFNVDLPRLWKYWFHNLFHNGWETLPICQPNLGHIPCEETKESSWRLRVFAPVFLEAGANFSQPFRRDFAMRRIDLLGGHTSAFTSKEETMLHFCKTTRHTQNILTYFWERCFRPT